jgi:hypothetical protein
MVRLTASWLVPIAAFVLVLLFVRWARLGSWFGALYRLWFAACWVAFAGGLGLIGLWWLGFAHNLNYETVSVVTASAFALLTLPLAWSEMRRRTEAKPAPRRAANDAAARRA